MLIEGVGIILMDLQSLKTMEASDFRRKATLGLAICAFLILSPFSINNFIQGRYLLGIGSLAIVVIITFNGWCITRDRYYSSLTLFGLVPAILFFLIIAFQKQGIIGALWCYPVILSFYIMLPERQAWFANLALLVIVIPQAWLVLEHPLVIRIAATLFAVSIFSVIFIRAIMEKQDKLEVMATTDPLTGLFNRTLLKDTLEQAIQQNFRNGTPMTIITFDLDRFKEINDALGHDAGDTALRGIAELLNKRFRKSDRVFRLGGEEFLTLLYDTDADHGRQIAEELRGAVAALQILPEHPVTVSIGAATLQSGESWTEWMKRSDENLYRAKLDGRNRVVA